MLLKVLIDELGEGQMNSFKQLEVDHLQDLKRLEDHLSFEGVIAQRRVRELSEA
jgi:hypothetical protein